MIEKLVPFCLISNRNEVTCPENYPIKIDTMCYQDCDS